MTRSGYGARFRPFLWLAISGAAGAYCGMTEPPSEQAWREAFLVAPTVTQDEAVFDHVMARFRTKYMEAVLRARGPAAEERAWEGFYFWMVFPATNRKPFEIPPEEANALLESLKPLVTRLQDGLREQRANQP